MSSDPEAVVVALGQVGRRSQTELQREAEEVKEKAAMGFALASIQALKIIVEALDDPDPQVRLRAAELIASRTIAKIAAQHVDPTGGVVESVDTVTMREQIMEQINKKIR